jgi:2'-5' RNA ligase
MAAADPVRAFFAVELGESLRGAAAEAIGELRRRDAKGAVRFTRPESLHVTLRFLGDVAVERLGGLVACVAKEATGVAPFALRLGGLLAFPNARRPRVIAVEALPAEPLAAAAAAVERGCVAAGFEPEARAFRGHLTLGRVKRGRPPRLDDVEVPDHEPTAVRDTVLFRSELGHDGSRYTPLERVPFVG